MSDLARVRVLYAELVDLEGDELSARLAAIADEDPALHTELASLLDHMGTQAAELDDLAGLIDRTALDRVLDEAREAGLPDDVDGFHVVRLVAAGGMGRVYEAEQLSPRRRVALKLLHTDLARPQMLRRFRREAEILGLLGHPGIAQIHELGTMRTEHGERPYFVMEYVDGVSLTEHAREHDLDVLARLDLFARVCDAVQHAHDHGVIHRDLKPDNILVDARGDPKVLDFGVARVTGSDLQASTLVTEVGQVMGTLPYMSPEQVSGDPTAIDGRSDVYALGVVLFELLSGRRPHAFDGRSMAEAARVITEEDATSLSSLDTSLRGDVDTIVASALEKDIDRRYTTAGALARDIRRFLAHEPIEAHPASTLYRVRKFTRRHTGLVVGTLLAVLALVTGLVLSLNFALGEAQQRQRAEGAGYRALLAAAAAAIDDGDREAGRALLDEAPENLRGWEWHHARARLDPLLWKVDLDLTPHDGLQYLDATTKRGAMLPTLFRLAACFSLDERLLAALVTDDRVDVFDAETGDRLRSLPLSGRLSHNGLIATTSGFLTVTRDGQVGHWDGRTGERLAADVVPGPVHGMAWDERHQRLAVATEHLPERASVLHVGPIGALRQMDTGDSAPYPVAWTEDGETLVTVSATDWECAFATPGTDDAGEPTLDLRPNPGVMMAYGLHGGRLVARPAGAGAGVVTVVDLEGDELVRLDLPTYSTIFQASFSGDGRRIVMTSGWGLQHVVSVHDATSGHALARWTEGPTAFAALSPSGRLLAVGDEDRLTVRSLDAPATTVRPGPGAFAYDLAWAPDGRTLWARSMALQMRGYDVVVGTVVHDLPRPDLNPDVHNLSTSWRTWGLSADGRRWVTAALRSSRERKMGVSTYDLVAGGRWSAWPGKDWDRVNHNSGDGLVGMPRTSRLELLKATGAIGPSEAPLEDLVVTRRSGSHPRVTVDPSGRLMVGPLATYVERVDGTGRVPLLLGGRELKYTGGFHASWSHADVSFSPDGSLLAAVRPKKHQGVVVHDVVTGAPVAELLTGSDAAELHYAVAFSPDGRRLAVAGTDRVVSLFDTTSWELVSRLEGHRGYIKDVAWSPDGETLATASGDGTVRLWSTRSLAERKAAAHAAAERREQQRPSVAALFEQLDDPHAVADAVRADHSLDDDARHAALRVVRELADAWWAAREDGAGDR